MRLFSWGGKLHAPPIDLVHPDVLRPAGWWAERCLAAVPVPADFWMLGCSHAENLTGWEPLLSMPTDDDIDPLCGPACITQARGRRTRMGELSHKKICIPLATLKKHALCSIRLRYAGVHHWMSFT